ncbi:hypothetical protein ATCC53582_02562 [Novacetimonas hansenii]|nr:hypothetical protein ATCC53582_02562 [Novacetimonas hansenii]
MTWMCKKRAVPALFFFVLPVLAMPLAGCGDGESHTHTVVVVPQGSKVVCTDGSKPPCPPDD